MKYYYIYIIFSWFIVSLLLYHLSLNVLNITKFISIAKLTCELRIMSLHGNLLFMNLFLKWFLLIKMISTCKIIVKKKKKKNHAYLCCTVFYLTL